MAECSFSGLAWTSQSNNGMSLSERNRVSLESALNHTGNVAWMGLIENSISN
jgi:hypothetical protein